MTKERLEELIKQNGLVYFGTYNEDNVFILREVKLSNCFICDNYLHDGQDCCYYDFVDLFETKEQAEWHCKMDAERTERFEPPMWEDIEDEYSFDFDCFTNQRRYGFRVIKHFDQIYIFKYNSFGEYTFNEFATKENYEKACGIVRDLFKGESNGKNS